MNLWADLKKNYDNKASRLTHIEGVVTWSTKLAHHLSLDVEAMKMAAYLHDFTKPLPDAWHLNIFQTYQEKLPDDFPAFAYHGISAALIGKHTYHIEDEDIFHAVYYHTTGRPQMSLFEKVLMFADKTEPSRPYEEADELRKAALNDFDQAFVWMLKLLKEYDLKLKRPITEATLKTYDYYLSHQEEA